MIAYLKDLERVTLLMINLTQNFAELLDARSYASLNKIFNFNWGNSGFPYQPTASVFIDYVYARVMGLKG